MIGRLKHRWQEFRHGEPGDRFQAQYRVGADRKGRLWMRALRMTLGVAVTLIGLVMLPAPGPGMPIVALGLAMLANESQAAAKLLDAAELRLRRVFARLRRWWRERRR